MEMISAVVPCYNEEQALPLFYEEIIKVAEKMKNVEFEFVFVDDGSSDKTFEIIKALRAKDKRVKYISFSRNFGKEAAIYAGFQKSRGDFVAMLDADLQDPPALLEEMYRSLKEEDYDCAATRRVTRKGEPPIRSFFARCFYKIINRMSRVHIVDGARDFRLMKRKMVDAVLEMSEVNRFSKGIFAWVGFKTKWFEYENIERVAGETKWSFWKLFLYSIEGIVAFTTVPLSFSTAAGIFTCFLSVILAVVFACTGIFGWNSGLLCLVLFLAGIQFVFIGLIGQYLSKTYLETKKRPVYFVRETEEDN